MLAKDIMTKKAEIISPDTTLMEAAKKMEKEDIGFLPIGENDRLIGAITDRDIVIRGVASGKDINKTTVRDFMTDEIRYCFENDSEEKIVKMMCDLQIRRLAVLNDDKRITGVVSLGDISTKVKDDKLCHQLAEAVSED